MITLVGCQKTVPSANMNVSVQRKKQDTQIIIPETTKEAFNTFSSFEIEAPDKTYYLNSDKTLFSDKKGRYYYVHKDGRDSGYYVLGRETDDGKYFFLENADDFEAYLYKDNVFYGVYRENKFCSYKDGKYKFLKYKEVKKDKEDKEDDKEEKKEEQEKIISDFYFTEEYIYFICRNEDGTEFMRMRYDGSDGESVAYINLPVKKYAVYNNRIFYEADYMQYGVYNIETSANISLDEGGAGIFSGVYMYFVSADHNLYRMNTTDYSCEKICENVRRIAFYDGYIIYQPHKSYARGDGQIYRLGKGENKKIFDAGELLEKNYYYDISVIQADKEKIYIKINSGPYYNYIAEIDIDGNIVDKIYEHDSV